MRQKPANALSVFFALLSASLLLNCGGGGMSNRPATLSRILITAASTSIPKGTDLALTATGIFSDGSEKNVTASAIWQAGPASVAKVDATGNLSGLGVGTAQVSAVYLGVTGNTAITIAPAALLHITVTAPQSTLPQGESEALAATGSYTDGSTQNLTTTVTWQATPANIASVSAQGELKGLNAGAAQVSAAYHSVTGNASVTVGAAALLQIAVNAPRSSLPLGESESLTATGTYSNGTTQDLTQQVTWTASPASVVAIDGHGNLSGHGQGVGQASAAYQAVTGSASVTVGSAALLRIDISPEQSSLPLGESEPLTATGSFSDGTTQNLTKVVVWNSSQPGVASVNPAGAVAAKSQGSATIGATVGSIGATASLTVTAPVVVGILINPPQSALLIGATGQLQAIATYSDGSMQDVTATATWVSEQPNVVNAADDGVVTAENVGTAIIQAIDSGSTGSASLTVSPMMLVSYYSRINAVNGKLDTTVRLVDPGYTQGDMCAMIYVFDQTQEMNECCGCVISDSGLVTLSLMKDLTSNPLIGKEPAAGDVEIVPATLGPNGQCNAGNPNFTSTLAGWETNAQQTTGGHYTVTEIPATVDALSPTEAQVLAVECGMVQTLGSGSGICSCGTGN